jgi:hypothetical protein
VLCLIMKVSYIRLSSPVSSICSCISSMVFSLLLVLLLYLDCYRSLRSRGALCWSNWALGGGSGAPWSRG